MQTVVHFFVFAAFPYLLFIDATAVVVSPTTTSALQDHKSSPTVVKLLQNGTDPVDNSTIVNPTLPPQPQPAPTTPVPPAPPTPAPYVPDRKFDGPSFIGGIVLCAGLTAIGFVSWKFYKARVELTYRTL
uniref:Sialomucin core protein 24 n=1 Tax=Cacopsylla melanoneura TaxID=428564 RepID=A0A8D8W4G5_9HEMI